MSKLVLIRHGQSEWNLSNQFTGWVDVNGLTLTFQKKVLKKLRRLVV